jgi:hypothetical protein
MQAISKSYLIILVFIISLNFCGFSQKNIQSATNEPVLSKVIVKDTKVKSYTKPFLSQALFDPSNKNLPYFLNHIEIDGSVIPTLEYNESVVRNLSSEELEKIKEYKTLITNTFEVSTYSEKSRSEIIVYHKIIPIRLNPSSNQYEYLESYVPNWNFQKENLDLQSKINKKNAKASAINSSVLATGDWYKIGVTQNGIYKLDKTALSNLGINTATINPKNIRIYGNGGKLLSEKNSDFKYDDLQENAIEVIGESDSVFDATDYVLFYGQSTDDWKHLTGSTMPFEHRMHYYSDTSFYFITTDLGLGKRVQAQNNLSNAPNQTTSKQDFYGIHEVNATNVVKSGREFFGEKFDFNTSYSFLFNISDAAVGDSLYVHSRVLGRAITMSNYAVNFNNGSFIIACAPTNTSDYLADIGYLGEGYKGGTLGSSNLVVTVTKQTSDATGWLDKIEFNCRRNLVFNSSQFNFRDRKVVGGAGSFAKYILINNNTAPTKIWDITNPLNPYKQLYNQIGNTIDFTATADSLKQYCIFEDNQAYKATVYGKIANQNLHAFQQADLIIVTHPQFVNEAMRIAQFHQDFDTLTYVIATTDQVYNEFSSGTPDIGAIREFTRMLYKRPSNPNLATQYLLLFGDGSYKNKDISIASNSALIPTYETFNSTSNINSFVTDDFFGMMDDNEGDMTSGLVDIGVGRFPVRSKSEAEAVTNKMEHYYKRNLGFDANATESSCSVASNDYPQGDWRNRLCFTADDEDGNLHESQADGLANSLAADKDYNVNKIFVDAYVQVSTPGGDRYPDAVIDINTSFEKGCLIWNYTGHGGEVGLGAERFVEISQILGWKNINNLPLMVTATCEFSRFDDPDRTSAGELCLLNPDGGAIGLLTTARVAFSDKNATLNAAFFSHAITPMTNGKMPHIGDLYRLTKIDIGVPFNALYLNFVILGDPALKLAYPEQRVYTSSVNSQAVTSSSSDTLKALSKITITGFVGDKNGNKLTTFNGVVFPTVFDKANTITTLSNDPPAPGFAGSPVTTFTLQKNNIYRGKSTVVNGDFSFTFLVPKDISYNYGIGKVSYYAHNGVHDAQGFYDKIIIGGSNPNAVVDNQGPTINLYMNDEKFVSGGTTNENPKIYAVVSDSSGINTIGTGIGHDAVAVIDATSSKPIILNDYYVADLNTYQKGKIRYPLNELSEGNHSLSVKIWDVQNNSSTSFTDFVVSKQAELALTHILNYPNPFTTKTKFFIEHNQCCTSLKVMVQIYTITGKVVKSINQTINDGGFRLDGIEWDGRDEYGDKLARGVYIYRVSVSDNNKKKAEKIEKLVILN